MIIGNGGQLAEHARGPRHARAQQGLAGHVRKAKSTEMQAPLPGSVQPRARHGDSRPQREAEQPGVPESTGAQRWQQSRALALTEVSRAYGPKGAVAFTMAPRLSTVLSCFKPPGAAQSVPLRERSGFPAGP